MSNPILVVCDRCGIAVELHPPDLPPTGGCASFSDDPISGWRVLEFVCGPCWESRRRDWTCVHCGDASYELALSCRGCGRARPGVSPYQPDWDSIWKEERERKREHDSLVAEWDREYPGWRSPKSRDRL